VGQRRIGRVLFLTGAGGLVGGLAMGGIALWEKWDRNRACNGQWPQCTDQSKATEIKNDQATARTAGNISTIVTISAGVLLVAGVITLLSAPDRREDFFSLVMPTQ
jgi:hypothetical protein